MSHTLIKASSAILQEAKRVLELNFNCLQNWALERSDQFPPFAAPDTKSAEVEATAAEGHEYKRTKSAALFTFEALQARCAVFLF